MTYEKAIYWLDEIKRAYIRNGDEDFDRQRKEAIDFAIYCITEKISENKTEGKDGVYCKNCVAEFRIQDAIDSRK